MCEEMERIIMEELNDDDVEYFITPKGFLKIAFAQAEIECREEQFDDVYDTWEQLMKQAGFIVY